MSAYHFCCEHSAAAICADTLGFREYVLRPQTHTPDPCMVLYGRPAFPERPHTRLLWFTSDPAPSPVDCGLTSVTLACDRMEYRFGPIVSPKVVRWETFADEWKADPEWRADLESLGAPETWWVATVPVTVPMSHVVRFKAIA